MSRASQDEAGERGSYGPTQVSDKVLYSRPSAGRAGPRQRLGDGPYIGGTYAKRRRNQNHRYYGESWTCKNAGNQKDGSARHSDARKSLSHEGGSLSRDNPAVGKPAADGGDGRAQDVSRSHGGRHFVHGKIPSANQVSPASRSERNTINSSCKRGLRRCPRQSAASGF